ncbi:hypothetical protein LP420_37640 [Massilia sp. B-10]|nr:hypothetical protein LP420_37640 [Massilia sp. B-10]
MALLAPRSARLSYGASQAPLLDMLKALQSRMPEQFAATPMGPNAAEAVDVFYLPRLEGLLAEGGPCRAATRAPSTCCRRCSRPSSWTRIFRRKCAN